METLRKTKPALNGKHAQSAPHTRADLNQAKAHMHEAKEAMSDAVGDLWVEGKKMANEWYEDGLQRLNTTEHELEQYADQMVTRIKKNPLKAVLIAGGIGFLFASLLKK